MLVDRYLKGLDSLVTVCLAAWFVRRCVYIFSISFADSEKSFAVRELGKLAVLQFASKRAGSFVVRELGELAVLYFASKANWSFTVSRVRRTGGRSVAVKAS